MPSQLGRNTIGVLRGGGRIGAFSIPQRGALRCRHICSGVRGAGSGGSPESHAAVRLGTVCDHASVSDDDRNQWQARALSGRRSPPPCGVSSLDLTPPFGCDPGGGAFCIRQKTRRRPGCVRSGKLDSFRHERSQAGEGVQSDALRSVLAQGSIWFPRALMEHAHVR